MNERERLIEFFHNAFAAWGDGVKGCKREEFFADFIAHGETAQEWISVEDRLPEVGKNVLLFSTKAGVAEGVRTADGMFWQFRWYAPLTKKEVTHWRPMPEPPKGE